jgi:hypothetical protein
MVDHAWLIWWYISWICSERVVLFVFLFDHGWSCMTYMVVHILDLFREGGVVCFSFWLWLIMHDLYGGTDLGSVQTVWCCLFFWVKKKNKQHHPLWTDPRYVPPYKSCMINHSQKGVLVKKNEQKRSKNKNKNKQTRLHGRNSFNIH